MIIDLLNYCQYNPGTEANILFRLQENRIHVPSFFCITEDFTEDELNNYLSNHYQHTKNFIVRLSLSFEPHENHELLLSEKEPPHYLNIPKSIVIRYVDRLFSEAKDYIRQQHPEKQKNISAHVIVQEMVEVTAFGCMQTACNLGVMNETIITFGSGTDAHFEERGVPFSIYCHNNDDGILFAHEPDGAPHCQRPLLRALLRVSEQLKSLFQNYKLDVKFVADDSIKRLYVISVQQISALSDDQSEEIVLDTKGVCNYYPGVTRPLLATMVQALAHEILRMTFERISNKPIPDAKLLDLIVYVNGRLYFDTKRLHHLQSILFFREETERFINSPVRLFWSHFWSKHGISRWQENRKIALGLQRLLAENLAQRKSQEQKFQKSLERLALAGERPASYEQLLSAFETVFSDFADCLRANLFNTLYINMNQRLLSRLKPGEKKYKRTEATIAAALDFRSELRTYHAKFMEQITEYAKYVGTEFAALGFIEQPLDIYYLSLEQVYAARSGKTYDFRACIAQKKKEIAWYKSMPGFTRLVFHKEIVNAPCGVVDFLDTLQESCHLRGCGLTPGNAVYPAVVCKENQIPENANPYCIYIVPALPEKLSGKVIGGLIVEDAQVFANMNPDVAACKFPIVVGAEHACTLIHDDDLVDLNGMNGEIHIKCIRNMNAK